MTVQKSKIHSEYRDHFKNLEKYKFSAHKYASGFFKLTIFTGGCEGTNPAFADMGDAVNYAQKYADMYEISIR